MSRRYTKPAIKGVRWIGTAYHDLAEFPAEVRQDLGFELHKVQAGDEPSNWKPMEEVGPGSRELRVQDRDGWYRAIYVTKFDDAVYVLHVFQKKTNATSREDIQKASRRYKALKREIESGGPGQRERN